MKLFLLPGFLGETKDFAEFRTSVVRLYPDVSCEVFDWYNEAPELLNLKLNAVGKALWPKLSAKLQNNEEFVILGYSLGGRLVLSLREELHHLNQKARYIFVSANPGLESEEERQARLVNDQKWAQRFENEEWEDVLKAWNAQGVFQSSKHEPKRLEQNFDRKQLGKVLTNWSLANQKDYRSQLQSPIDYLWMTGALDQKFTALAQASITTPIVIPDGGHRLHIDKPEELAKACQKFLSRA